MVQFSHPYMTTRKIIALTIRTLVSKVMSLLFNMLSRFVIVFLPRSKHCLFVCFLISWLQAPSAVILEPKKIKSVTVSIVSPSICHEVMGLDAKIFIFWVLSFKPTFSISSFTFIKRLFILFPFCYHTFSFSLMENVFLSINVVISSQKSSFISSSISVYCHQSTYDANVKY